MAAQTKAPVRAGTRRSKGSRQTVNERQKQLRASVSARNATSSAVARQVDTSTSTYMLQALQQQPINAGATCAVPSSSSGLSWRRAPTMGGKVMNVVKLAIQAGKASPSPPVGPALGSKGVNIMAFCKEYNAQTAEQEGQIVPVEITIYEDKSFSFVLRTPPTSELLKSAAGVKKGSGTPPRTVVGSVTQDQVREIANTKLPDLNTSDMDVACRTVQGTARNMGIRVKEDE